MMIYRFCKNIIISTVLFVIFIFLLLNAVCFILDILPNKDKLFSHIATEILQQPVAIKQANIQGFLYEPTFVFHDIAIGKIQLHKLQIDLNLWRSIQQKKWVTKKILVDHLHVRVNQDAKQRVSISGLSSNVISLSNNSTVHSPFIAWMATQPEIDLLHTQVDLSYANQVNLPIDDLNLSIKNNDDTRLIVATAQLKQAATFGTMRLVAQVDHDRARIFLQGHQINLAKWVPFLGMHGETNVKVWATYVNHRIQQVHSEFTVHNFSERTFKIKQLSANVVAHLVKNAWQINLSSLKFTNPGLDVFAQSTMHFDPHAMPALLFSANASINGDAVNDIHGSILSIKNPLLKLQATIKIDLAKAQQFLSIPAMSGSGPALCDLTLELSLDKQPMRWRTRADIHFLDDQIELPKWDLTFTGLTGLAKYDDGNILATKLRMQLFNEPLSISIAGKHYFHVILSGILNPDAFAQRKDFGFLKLLHGQIPFHTAFDLPETVSFGFPDMTISLGAFNFLNQHYPNLMIGFVSKPDGESIHLHNADMLGDLFVPLKKEYPLRAYFHYLLLQSAKPIADRNHADKAASTTINPALIPPLNVLIDDLQVNHRADGRLKLISEPIQYGLAIRELKLNSPLVTLNAKGYWISRFARPETFLSGNAHSSDLGELLMRRHLSTRLKGGNFSTEFALQWPGTPQTFMLSRASGKVNLKIVKGRILQLGSNTESSLNIARLFNILSMETLTHLLTFDVNAIGKSGFPFDYLQGNLDLQSGVLFTRDVEMDGALAKVNFAGRVNLSSGPNDLSMVVYPKVSTTVMTLVGMTGGPVIGAAAWLANKLISPVVGHMMKMDYHVGGTWDHPLVRRVN